MTVPIERLEEGILALTAEMTRLREELADHERALAALQRAVRARLVKPIDAAMAAKEKHDG